MTTTVDHSPTNSLNPRYGMDFAPYLANVEISRLDADPANERPEIEYLPELLGDLMTSMRAIGLQEPIRVFAQPPSNRYLVSSGHRRLAAAKALGWSTVPAIIAPPPPKASPDQDVARIAANLCRKDLDAVSLARGIKAVIEQHGLTQAKVGAMLGKSQSAVANLVRLLELPEEVLKVIESGKLTAGHGLELLRVQGDELGYNGQPTGHSAGAVQTRLALEAIQRSDTVSRLRQTVGYYQQNQKHYQKQAAARAKEAAERAAAIAEGKDPQEEANARARAEHEAYQATQAAERQRREARQAVILRLLRDLLLPEGNDGTAALRLYCLSLDKLYYGTDGKWAPLEARILAADTTSDQLVALLIDHAPDLLGLSWDGLGITSYGPGARWMERTFGLKRKIADALLEQKLITKAEHKRLCEGKA